MKMSLVLRYMTLTTLIITHIVLKLDLVASISRTRSISRPPKHPRSTHNVDLDLGGRGDEPMTVIKSWIVHQLDYYIVCSSSSGLTL